MRAREGREAVGEAGEGKKTAPSPKPTERNAGLPTSYFSPGGPLGPTEP